MNNERKTIIRNRLLTIILTLNILFSLLIVTIPISEAAEIEISKINGVTCGEIIWLNVTNEDLIPNNDYIIQIEKTSGSSDWENILIKRSDGEGNFSAKINVPQRVYPGTYSIRLINKSDTDDVYDIKDIEISNVFKVKFRYNKEEIQYVIWNKNYAYPESLDIEVYFWSGKTYELLNEKVAIELYDPSGNLELSDLDISNGIWNIDYIFDFIDGSNLETEYVFKVYKSEKIMSQYLLPVRLNITFNEISTIIWGNQLTINGYVKDSTGIGISNYKIRLYSPEEEYKIIDEVITFSTGRFAFNVQTTEGNAGTWYIGTFMHGDHRINNSKNTLGIYDGTGNFIWYKKIKIDTDESATINLIEPKKINSGFNQNITLKAIWKEKPLSNAWIYITGLKTSYNGLTYNAEEKILCGITNGSGYLEIEKITFKEAGTVYVSSTYPEKEEHYTDKMEYEANIIGNGFFKVNSPSPLNFIVDNPPTKVSIDDSTNKWINVTDHTTKILVYGINENEHINANIEITGCGVDINIDENDYKKPDGIGIYYIEISPKTGGTLKIKARNTSTNYEATQEFSIDGLSGSVYTGILNDKEITVKTNETINVKINGGDYSEIHLTYIGDSWDISTAKLIKSVIGDGITEGKGLNGIFNFQLSDNDITHIGHIIVAAKIGSRYLYDIIDIVPSSDLIIDIVNPDDKNLTLTAGIPNDIELQVVDQNGLAIEDIDSVTGKLINLEGDIVEEILFNGPTSQDIWYISNWVPEEIGELVIYAVNNTDEDEHKGSTSLTVSKVTINFSPDKVTAGIELDDIIINISALDANDNPIPEGTKLYINIQAEGTFSTPQNEDDIVVDEKGEGTFTLDLVGDHIGFITLELFAPDLQSQKTNLTDGKILVEFPSFVIDPEEIYLETTNPIRITSYDANGQAIKDLYLTLISSTHSSLFVQPDPVKTDDYGTAVLYVSPISIGTLNVTIARNIKYVKGQLTWDNSVITDSVIHVTSKTQLKISLSKSIVYENDSLIVTVTSADIPINDVIVTLGDIIKYTDDEGKVTFEISPIEIDSMILIISAEKTGYYSAEKSITILNRHEIMIIGPSIKIPTDSIFTVTIVAHGNVLSGATVKFDKQTGISDANGKVTFYAPLKDGNYTVTASFENFKPGSELISVIKSDIPGFEVLFLFIAIIIVFIGAYVIKMRKK